MSYTPTEWASGDIITAEKLNKIESGIESASSDSESTPLIVNMSVNSEGYTLDKTFGEIRIAYEAGRVIKLVYFDEGVYGNNLDIFFISGITYHNQDGVNPSSSGYIFYIDCFSSPSSEFCRLFNIITNPRLSICSIRML